MGLENDALGKGVGGAVDMFASFMQGQVNRAVMHQARQQWYEYHRDRVLETLRNPPTESRDQCLVPGAITGVLLVIGVEEPRTVDLGLEPRWRRFLALGVAGYGNDPVRVKEEYLRQPRIEAIPENNRSLMRVNYYVWMNYAQALSW
ncbi:hypothetical protein KUV47_04185 [Vannielia litorea]|uniref:hypothetical protein n=1 Tax=Vannielia TaxID=2813041 RepID=UPI001C93AE44|nr:hypothetical protein [Vannielia litorea]MBY6152403.1 hypothetical protein [Vannielia litorea]